MKTPGRTSERRHDAGFSMMELVVVVVIMGVVASIAVPRLSAATSRASSANTQANIAQLEHSIEHYAAEHEDRSPAEEIDGSINEDEGAFLKRLLMQTDASGETGGKRIFGPYLHDIPLNVANGLRRIRIDGEAAGANTHGWRFDTTLRVVEPDDREQAPVFRRINGRADDIKPADGEGEVDGPVEAEAGK